jgi:hypothetical protein
VQARSERRGRNLDVNFVPKREDLGEKILERLNDMAEEAGIGRVGKFLREKERPVSSNVLLDRAAVKEAGDCEESSDTEIYVEKVAEKSKLVDVCFCRGDVFQVLDWFSVLLAKTR